MLGTGKGCVKPPDIVLHGTGDVAPQHCFIERLDDEVVLHPISELTTVDGSRVSGPTTLLSGKMRFNKLYNLWMDGVRWR